MNALGLIIKQLQKKQGLSGQELANLIGITPPNLSQIVNGHSKPRQTTFSKLCRELVSDQADEKLLVDAFLLVKEETPEMVSLDSGDYERTEIERAERYLEMKLQSIAFKRSVAHKLDQARIEYQQDYSEKIYVTDFLVLKNNQRIALECKFNIHRDMDKATTIARLLSQHLNCDRVAIVVPFMPEERITDSKSFFVVEAKDLEVFLDET